MVNLMTYDYYKQYISQKHTALQSADAMFEELLRLILQQLHESSNEENTKKTLNKIFSIAKKIDGVGDIRYLYGITPTALQVSSKFTPSTITLLNLSTGCKVALNIWFLSHYNDFFPNSAEQEHFYLDITEAGPNALIVCLNLLNNAPKLTGVLGAAIPLRCKNSLDFEIDFQYISKTKMPTHVQTNEWIDIFWEAAKDAND